MPALQRKKKPARPDPDAIFVCVENHWTGADGVPVFYREGARVRGSHIAAFSPSYWAVDGLDETELAKAKQALRGGEPAPLPEPEKPRLVRATKSFTTTRNAAPGPVASGPVMFSISVGDVLPEGHPLVQQYADAFERVKS